MGCTIETRGELTPKGYRRVWVDGTKQMAHRVAYQQEHGEIPEGHQVHHTCGRKDCVNPDHLVTLTDADHRAQHLRAACRKGHPYSAENTYYRKGTRPQCRVCKREADRRRRADRRVKKATG